MKYLFAIILPPLALLMCGKPFQFLLNIVLTCCLWVPGAIHAILVVRSHEHKKNSDRVVEAIQAQGMTMHRHQGQLLKAPKK